ncbi:MAG: DNA internalization-related competence protein ComEC/Rec2 [Deltaproteobacteria bacterium]|nr:DNA internalization-related competence protein ComEC/Rec2 [Candidatus Zymogenaceae bacterium]
MRHPLPLITLALMAGIGLGVYLHIPVEIPLLLALVSLILVLAFGNARFFFPISIALFFFLGTALVTSALQPGNDADSISDYSSRKNLAISGTVARAPRIETDATRIVLSDLMVKARGAWRPVGGKLQLTVGERISNVSYGDTLFFVGTVKKPRNFNNPGGFDYEFSLLRAGISATSFVDGTSRLLIRNVKPSSPMGLIERTRDTVRDFYDVRFPTPEGAIIKALVLGERGDVPEELLSAYYRTGVGHVLAISGSNVGIVFIFTYLFFYAVLVRLGPFPLRHLVRKWASVVSFAPVIVYTFLAGVEITVVRATLMISVFILAVLIEREQQVFNTLVLAAFVILMLLPASLFDPSFQLSFIAVASIIVIYPPLVEPLKKRFFPIDGVSPPLSNRLTFRLLQFTLVSCAAIIGILPVSAYYFHRVTPLALPLNFVVVPLLGPVATTLGLLSVPFIAAAPPIASFLGLLAAWAISLSDTAVVWTDALLPNGIVVFGPTIFEMILYYGLIFSVFLYFKKRRLAVILAVLLSLTALADVSFTAWHRYHPKRLEATFLSVGNGDSCVIKLPGGDIMVVDGGGLPGSSFDTGRYIVAPFLSRERIGRIDYMVLSHPQRDHVGGLIYLMNNFRVGELWVTSDAFLAEEAVPLIVSALSLGTPVITIDSSTPRRTIGTTIIRFLGPGLPSAGEPRDLNNRSLVFRLDYGRFSLLMTGDIEREGFARIQADRLDVSAVVLKAPHHGSPSSNSLTFLEAVNPRAAIISCGYENPFGFPGKKSLTGLREVGADVFRTDLDGAVTVTTDGGYIEIESMGGRRLYEYIPGEP